MKLSLRHSNRIGCGRRDERGYLLITLLLLVSLMLIYVALGLRSLNGLHQNLKRVEQKQIQRLQR